MPRITRAQLLSPDRSAVVLPHGRVARALYEPLAFSETYPEAPALEAHVHGPDRAAWSLGRVLRLEYDDGTAEAWRVQSSGASYSSGDSWGVRLRPLWAYLGRRTLVAEIEGTSVATPRLSLVSRTPASCLGVAFDPLNGAPATASGAPMFVVGSVDERYAGETVDVSVLGGSPLDVVKAVCAQLRCLWRPRLVLSGDGPGDEVYEVDLVAPQEPPTVSAEAFGRATALEVPLGEVGNAAATWPRPNVERLTVEDDDGELVTALVPLAPTPGEDDPVGVGLHVFRALAVSALSGGRRTLTLGGRFGGAALVVPFDGALDGLLACRLDDEDPAEAWAVVGSAAPDSVTLDMDGFGGGSGALFGLYRFYRPGATADAPRRAFVQLVNGPAAETYGVLSEARTFDDVAPHANEFANGACDLDGAGEDALPLGFVQVEPTAPVTWAWTDAENSVSLGARSAQFTAAAAGSGVYATSEPLAAAGASRARAAWASLRVVSGRVEVTVLHNVGAVAGMSPASIVVTAGTDEAAPGTTNVGGLVLTTVEMVAADVGPGTIDVWFEALDAGTVWVVDGVTVVQAPAVQPYRSLMGPNALWARAWDDLMLAPRRVTTATTTAFDPEALGLGGGSLAVGAWVRVRPDGRDPFDAQVLEAGWRQSLGPEGEPGGLAAEREMRLGPPPYDLVSRLSTPAARARAPEGSKRAPVYPVLLDRGAVPGGRLVEAGPGATITAGATTRTFRGVTYTLPTLAVGPAPVRTLAVRRLPGRDDAALLRLTSAP